MLFVSAELETAGSVGLFQLNTVQMFAQWNHGGEEKVQQSVAALAADEVTLAGLREALEEASLQQLVCASSSTMFDSARKLGSNGGIRESHGSSASHAFLLTRTRLGVDHIVETAFHWRIELDERLWATAGRVVLVVVDAKVREGWLQWVA
jgi:hypothetical protein